MKNLQECDAVGLSTLIRKGEVSAPEVLERAIEDTEAKNPELNAVVTKIYDEAMLQAKKPLPESPVAGVPFLIKDLNFVKDVPCSFGSRLFENFVPDHDADIVKRYREAGLLIFGKTNTPEFGLACTTESVLLGPCRNPWNTGYTTGGSSGGAAAAVAAGILPAAHATDGGGSIRIPASCCGLVGLKPTRGRTPLGPDVGEGWGGMAIGHVVSRSVRDSAAFLDISHGASIGDPYAAPYFGGSYLKDHQADPGKLRIAINLTPMTDKPVHAECIKAVTEAASLCELLGHYVEEATPDVHRDAFGEAVSTVILANVAHTIQARCVALGVEPSADNLEHLSLVLAEGGRSFTADQYAAAMLHIHQATRTMGHFFQHYDVVLSPTLLSPPVSLGWMDTNSPDFETYNERFTAFWGFTNLYNATGQPSMSLPLHLTPDRLPVGVQFSADAGHECLLLQLGRQLEEVRPFARL